MKRYQKQMHNAFRWAHTLEFKRVFKREFYGWAYGNEVCQRIHDDFYQMFLMGGEL